MEALETIMETAVNTFASRAAGLVPPDADVSALWKAGLGASYKAELRAESPERVDRLLESYGDWPASVTQPSQPDWTGSSFAWRLRGWQGALLSAARLIKGVFTFDGGVDYIAWKISRHAGFSLPVKEWERRWPLLGIPFLARRYYRLKKHSQP